MHISRLTLNFYSFFNVRNPVWTSEFGLYVDGVFKSFQQFPDLTDADIKECQRNVKVSGKPGVTYDAYFTSAISLTDDDDQNELLFDNVPDAFQWGALSDIILSFIKQMSPSKFNLRDTIMSLIYDRYHFAIQTDILK